MSGKSASHVTFLGLLNRARDRDGKLRRDLDGGGITPKFRYTCLERAAALGEFWQRTPAR